MNGKDLTKQEEHLFAVLSGKRFLQMEGLSNEVPFFIYPYAPEDALTVADTKKRIKNRLSQKGISVREVNLYDLSVEILKERGVWERVLAAEPGQDKDDFRELLQGMLDPQLHIAPAIRSRIADGEFDICNRHVLGCSEEKLIQHVFDGAAFFANIELEQRDT